jgi:hypothetical protein
MPLYASVRQLALVIVVGLFCAAVAAETLQSETGFFDLPAEVLQQPELTLRWQADAGQTEQERGWWDIVRRTADGQEVTSLRQWRDRRVATTLDLSQVLYQHGNDGTSWSATTSIHLRYWPPQPMQLIVDHRSANPDDAQAQKGSEPASVRTATQARMQLLPSVQLASTPTPGADSVGSAAIEHRWRGIHIPPNHALSVWCENRLFPTFRHCPSHAGDAYYAVRLPGSLADASWRVRLHPLQDPTHSVWSSAEIAPATRVFPAAKLPASSLRPPTWPLRWEHSSLAQHWQWQAQTGWRLAPPWQTTRQGATQSNLSRLNLPRLAPLTAWRQGWTGFAGPRHANGNQAEAIEDALLQQRLPCSIDLLPSIFAGEQGTFRFGTSPWRDAASMTASLRATETQHDLLWQARDSIARWHWLPQVQQWHLGVPTQEVSLDQQDAWQRITTHITEVLELLQDNRIVTTEHAWPRSPQTLQSIIGQPKYGWTIGPEPLPWYTTPVTSRKELREQRRRNRQQSSQSANPQDQPNRLDDLKDNGSLTINIQDGTYEGIVRRVSENWFAADALSVDLSSKATKSGWLQIDWYLTDQQHRWWQFSGPPLRTPIKTLLRAPLNGNWQPIGHQGTWHRHNLRQVRVVGLLVSWQADQERADQERTDQERADQERTGQERIDQDAAERQKTPKDPQQKSSATIVLNDLALSSGGPYQTDAPPTPTIARDVETLPATATAWRSITRSWQLNHQVENPYDPEQANLGATVVAPDGSQQRIHAYWYQPAQRRAGQPQQSAQGESWQLAEQGYWRWHFLPQMPGRHHITFDGQLQLPGDKIIGWDEAPIELHVHSNDAPKLLPITTSDDRMHWEYLDGNAFYPIGINLRSPSDDRQIVLTSKAKNTWASQQGTGAYDVWFKKMAANKMNYARVWMAPWWCGLEWTERWDDFPGLGAYNQRAAARLDRICNLAAEHNIYLQIELQNHGMVSQSVDEQFDQSPYNAALGGPCKTAADFFTNPEAWKFWTRRLRYTIARYGHHPHIMAWVLSSELEFTGAWWRDTRQRQYNERGHSPDTAQWVKKSLQWLHNHDPLKRPNSVHFSHPWEGPTLWREEQGLGFNNSNIYTGFQKQMGQLGGRQAGIGSAMHHYLNRHFPPWDLQRPTMLGEWGGHWEERDRDTLEAQFRTGLWLQAVLPFAGNVGFWWWLWVDEHDHWSSYASIAKFRQHIDWRGQNPRTYRPRVRGGDRLTYAFGSKTANQIALYVWLEGSDRRTAKWAAAQGGSMELADLPAQSTWRIRQFNPENGEEVKSHQQTASASGRLTIELDELSPDAVYLLER